MKVILTCDLANLGKKGDLKSVADGYARNLLIPRGLAVEATPQRLQEWEDKRHHDELKAGRQQRSALELAGRLESRSLLFRMAAGEGGRLFGSVTAADLAGELAKAGFQIDKKKIVLDEPIKHTGVYRVEIKLGPGIRAALNITVEKGE